MNTRLRTSLRTALSWLIIVAFAARGLIPVGYMPDFTGTSAAPTLRICTGMGPMHMAMPGKSGAPESPAKAQHDAPCSFSVNAVFGLDGIQPPLTATLSFLLIAVLALAAFAYTPQRRFGNASSRSPPLFI